LAKELQVLTGQRHETARLAEDVKKKVCLLLVNADCEAGKVLLNFRIRLAVEDALRVRGRAAPPFTLAVVLAVSPDRESALYKTWLIAISFVDWI
jgi:hypothetical protein